MKKHGVDLINYTAILLLDQFHIYAPTQMQIDIMESFILNVLYGGQFEADQKLTRRESECLYWAAKGKSSKETADILCISPNSVKFHRKKIKEKLNCKSMSQAVFTGMRYNLCPQSAQI